MRPAPDPFALLVATLALASCGGSAIDDAKAERFIRAVVAEQVGARVAAVTCPQDVEIRRGAKFTCVVTGVDGSKGDVLATQRDDDGSVVVDAPFLHVREAETVMTEQIEKQTKADDVDDVEVTCPEIVVVEKDALFRCKAASAGRSRNVTARLTDTQGHFRYRLGSSRSRTSSR